MKRAIRRETRKNCAEVAITVELGERHVAAVGAERLAGGEGRRYLPTKVVTDIAPSSAVNLLPVIATVA